MKPFLLVFVIVALFVQGGPSSAAACHYSDISFAQLPQEARTCPAPWRVEHRLSCQFTNEDSVRVLEECGCALYACDREIQQDPVDVTSRVERASGVPRCASEPDPELGIV